MRQESQWLCSIWETGNWTLWSHQVWGPQASCLIHLRWAIHQPSKGHHKCLHNPSRVLNTSWAEVWVLLVDSGLIVLVTTAQSGHGPFCSLVVLPSSCLHYFCHNCGFIGRVEEEILHFMDLGWCAQLFKSPIDKLGHAVPSWQDCLWHKDVPALEFKFEHQVSVA